MRRRQSRLREYLHDLIRELPLFCWKHRRVAVPTQTSANVLVDPRFLTRDLIRESMQVPDLIEQRLKLFVGDRHDLPGVRPSSDESFLTSPCGALAKAPHGARPKRRRSSMPNSRVWSKGRPQKPKQSRLRERENPASAGLSRGGRYWARTSDPQLVELVLSQLS